MKRRDLPLLIIFAFFFVGVLLYSMVLLLYDLYEYVAKKLTHSLAIKQPTEVTSK
jgi:hypothetical protein